jgi:hypothetical protein
MFVFAFSGIQASQVGNVAHFRHARFKMRLSEFGMWKNKGDSGLPVFDHVQRTTGLATAVP